MSNGKYWTVCDFMKDQFAFHSRVISNDASSMLWEEKMINEEAQRLQNQENNPLNVGPRNNKDDTTPWLLQTGWSTLFSEKNINIIGDTRNLIMENRQARELFSNINEKKSKMLGFTLDRVVTRALESLESTPGNILHWLRSPRRNEPDRRPFGKTQEL